MANNEDNYTLKDIVDMISKVASKEDIEGVNSKLTDYQTKTKEEIDRLHETVEIINVTSNEQGERIAKLEGELEMLKQEKIKNNIRITGLPKEWDGNAVSLVIKMCKLVGLKYSNDDFHAYASSNGQFVIASFHNHAYKSKFLNKCKLRKSIMVEEILRNFKSNSQLYVNDHLTPYFSNLFTIAWRAKKEGKLASASSVGGKVRVKKLPDDIPVLITNQAQLEIIIDLPIESIETSTEANSSMTAETISLNESDVTVDTTSASSSTNLNSNKKGRKGNNNTKNTVREKTKTTKSGTKSNNNKNTQKGPSKRARNKDDDDDDEEEPIKHKKTNS